MVVRGASKHGARVRRRGSRIKTKRIDDGSELDGIEVDGVVVFER